MVNKTRSPWGNLFGIGAGEMIILDKLVMNTIFLTVYSVKNCDHFHIDSLLMLWYYNVS